MPLIESIPVVMRRLPIYIVIEANVFKDQCYTSLVNEAIRCLLHSWKDNPWMLEVATMSVIGGKLIILQQSDIYDINDVEIQSDCDTAMVETLDLLKNRLNNEFVRTTVERKGDWKPLIIFFISDNVSNCFIQSFISNYSAKNRVYFNSMIISNENSLSDNDKNFFEVESQIVNHNSINNIRLYSGTRPSEWNSFWAFAAESYSNVSGRNISIGTTVYDYFMNNDRRSLKLSFIHP